MPTIENGVIHGIEHEEFFNVMLHNGDNLAIKLNCDFEDMPVKTLVKLAYDTMKVKFRPHVKGMQSEKFKKAYNNKTIPWREMISKGAIKISIDAGEQTDDEIDAQVARLLALKSNSAVNINDDEDNSND